MQRALTMLVTGLLAAFLCGVAGFSLSLLIPWPRGGLQGPDVGIAQAYGAVAIGFLAGVIGFFTTVVLADRWVPPHRLRSLQMADGLLLVVVLLVVVLW